MDNASLYTQINSLPSNLKEEVKDFVRFLISKSNSNRKRLKIREQGVLKGKIKLSSDFDAPVEDFNEYMK